MIYFDDAVNENINPKKLYEKSKILINYALMSHEDPHQHNIWCSLALEVLGKSLLSNIHPSLIVDPKNKDSILMASKIQRNCNLKTITWTELFDIIHKIVVEFDKNSLEFCKNLSTQRNTELHSGGSPFNKITPEQEGQYWNIADHLLKNMGKNLDNWVDVESIHKKVDLIRGYKKALHLSTKFKIDTARSYFNNLKIEEKTKLKSLEFVKNRSLFATPFEKFKYDLIWEVECPSCKSNAFMGGKKTGEIIKKRRKFDPKIDQRTYQFLGEVFSCMVCTLELNGYDEIKLAKLDNKNEEIFEFDHIGTVWEKP